MWLWSEWREQKRKSAEGMEASEEGLTGLGSHGITRSKFWRDLLKFFQWTQIIILDAAVQTVWASWGFSWKSKAASFADAFTFSACSLYAVLKKRGPGGPASPSLISQEQLVRKAASLCYLLSNEGTISLVSEDSLVSPVLSFLSILTKRKMLSSSGMFGLLLKLCLLLLGLGDHPPTVSLLSWFVLGVTAPGTPSCAVMTPGAQHSPSLRSRGPEPLLMHKPQGQGFVND